MKKIWVVLPVLLVAVLWSYMFCQRTTTPPGTCYVKVVLPPLFKDVGKASPYEVVFPDGNSGVLWPSRNEMLLMNSNRLVTWSEVIDPGKSTSNSTNVVSAMLLAQGPYTYILHLGSSYPITVLPKEGRDYDCFWQIETPHFVGVTIRQKQ